LEWKNRASDVTSKHESIMDVQVEEGKRTGLKTERDEGLGIFEEKIERDRPSLVTKKATGRRMWTASYSMTR